MIRERPAAPAQGRYQKGPTTVWLAFFKASTRRRASLLKLGNARPKERKP